MKDNGCSWHVPNTYLYIVYISIHGDLGEIGLGKSFGLIDSFKIEEIWLHNNTCFWTQAITFLLIRPPYYQRGETFSEFLPKGQTLRRKGHTSLSYCLKLKGEKVRCLTKPILLAYAILSGNVTKPHTYTKSCFLMLL